MSSTPDSEDYYYEDPYWALSPTTKIICATLIGVLIFVIVVGNLLTIISYLIDRRLHTVYDFYIFNLALADLITGAFSMPIYTRATMVNFYWELGKAMCKTWLAIDFTLCYMSIILIVFLSYDRLRLVTLGAQYTMKVTIQKARIQVAIGWVLAFCLYGPAELFWDTIAGYSTVMPDYCDYSFSLDVTFTMITAIIEFVASIIALGVINFLIYRKIRMRTRANKSAIASREATSAVTTVGETIQNGLQQDLDKTETTEQNKLSSAGTASNNKTSDTRLKRDTKAAKVLATIVIVFLVTWAPFTLTSIIISFCDSTCVNENWYEIMGWLLWSKSAINPFLYAYNSARYKHNFKRIIFFWKRHSQIHPVV